MRSFIVIFMFFVGLSLNAQLSITPADLVAQARTKNAPTSFSLMKLSDAQSRSNLPSELKEYSLLSLDVDMLRRIGSTDQSFVSITIPQASRSSIVLDLVEVSPLTDDFVVRSAPSMAVVKVKTGRHFRGIIRGQEKSVAAISVFDNEVMGLVSHPSASGNMVLGKLEDQDTYIFYQDDQIVNKISKACATADSGIPYTRDEITPTEDGSRALTDCVKLYLEVDNDIYINKGSSNANVTAYITGLFNQVSALYAAGQMNTVVSEIVIWSTTSPYANATTSVAMLNAFTAHRQGFNGNLAQLLSYRVSGGIAYVDGLCRTNPDYSMSYAGITSAYQNVPTYSWAVEVCAHEFGHLFGSQHTHACVWNGNGTAIDGCYAVEGSCPTPSPALPAGGGTIMSYCHLTNVGINFTNGFGTQPGNVMRTKVTNSNCTLPCSGSGGGGGGTPSCTQNALVLTLRTDNYPTETSWTIKNTAGTILFSGGGYTVANNVYTIPLCLPTACFTFTINDGYGDGICCTYGQGYYNIKQGATTLINGGAFGISETKSFCATGSGGTATCTDGIQNGQETGVDCGGPNCPACPTCTDGVKNGLETSIDCGGPTCPACSTCTDGVKNGLETGIDCGGPTCPACPSCTDGIQNGQETGVDCGGPTCPPCSTGGGSGGLQITNLAGHFFESGWDGWFDGGIDCYRYPGTLSPEGTYSIRLRDNEFELSAMTSPSYVLNTFDSVTVEFKFRADNFESGEDFWLRYFNGSTWTTIKSYVAGTDFNNNVVYTRKVKISAPLSSNGQFRFQSDADDNTDNVYIDAVSIKGYKTIGTPQPTCTDGVKNGLETGVDCGGPTCPPCPTCTDGIKNGLETGVDCGGPACPACPTCTDGIQNGNETGVDCGGSCPPCGTGGGGSTTTLSGHYFEVDWDGWADGGVDAFRYAGTFSSEGSYSIRLRDNSLEASAMTSPNYNLAQYNSVSITFKFKAEGMEPGEDFFVEYFNGSTWSTIGTFVSGTDFNNLALYTVTITKNAPLHNNAKFRITCDASENDDLVYIDAVVITATTANLPQGRMIKLLDNESHIATNNVPASNVINVYPNPAIDVIYIKSNAPIDKIRLITVTGKEVFNSEIEGSEYALSLEGYQSGIYLVVINDENGTTTKRIVKQ